MFEPFKKATFTKSPYTLLFYSATLFVCQEMRTQKNKALRLFIKELYAIDISL